MKNTVIWRLTLPGKPEQVSFLFGTFHVRDQRAFGWLAHAWPLIGQCECVATEFDLGDIDPAALNEVTTLPDDMYLDRILSPAVWKKVQRLCRKHLGMEAEAVRKLHPMMLSNALTLSHIHDDAPYAVDEQIYHYAKEKGLPVTGVESFNDQLEVMRNIPARLHLKNLVQLSKHFSKNRKRILKMLRWYAEGDIRKLYRAARKENKGMRKILIHDRNHHMAERISHLATEAPCFIAVGAGHLAGKQGLLRLLSLQGFTVTPWLPETAS